MTRPPLILLLFFSTLALAQEKSNKTPLDSKENLQAKSLNFGGSVAPKKSEKPSSNCKEGKTLMKCPEKLFFLFFPSCLAWRKKKGAPKSVRCRTVKVGNEGTPSHNRKRGTSWRWDFAVDDEEPRCFTHFANYLSRAPKIGSLLRNCEERIPGGKMWRMVSPSEDAKLPSYTFSMRS